MQAIVFFPAHPSYFDDEYTQEEIDKAIGQMKQLGRFPELQPSDESGIPIEIRFLREPGHRSTFAFVDPAWKEGDWELERFRRVVAESLRRRETTLRTILEQNRSALD